MHATLRKAINILKKGAERFGMLEIDDKPSRKPALFHDVTLGKTVTGKHVRLRSHTTKNLSKDDHMYHMRHHLSLQDAHRDMAQHTGGNDKHLKEHLNWADYHNSTAGYHWASMGGNARIAKPPEHYSKQALNALRRVRHAGYAPLHRVNDYTLKHHKKEAYAIPKGLSRATEERGSMLELD